MNREIKFRVWHDSPPKMVYGDMLFIVGVSDHGSASFETTITNLQAEYELMQYTGLKDVTGKEIYEGDIIEYVTCDIKCKGWIIWNEYVGGWQYQYKGAFGGTPSDYLDKLLYNTRFPKEVTVVGNIYENKDLIISQK